MSQTDVESILLRLRRHLTRPSRAQQGPPWPEAGAAPCWSPAALEGDHRGPCFGPGACLTPPGSRRRPPLSPLWGVKAAADGGPVISGGKHTRVPPQAEESFSDVTPLTHTTAAGISDAFLRTPGLLGRVHGPNTRRGNLAEDTGGAQRLPRADAVTEESSHVGAAACPKKRCFIDATGGEQPFLRQPAAC